jgi:NAD(P)-dependent dehydrogenase (short-subunit alcohol dehydrogenase family)
MTKLLENKVALVSGSSQGLGLAIAAALGVDGARVVVVSRSEEKAEKAVAAVEAGGGVASAWVGDLRGEGAGEELVDHAVKTYGKVDILVNSAGCFLWKSFMELSLSEWREVLEVNLTSAFALTQSAARVMIDEGRGGSIVNIASIHASVADENVVAQCASKSGLLGLTRASAEALRPYDIRVNAISPGSIQSDSAQVRGESPRKQVTQADLAMLVVYLSSDFARTITGAAIDAFGSTRTLIKI